jgi:tRNA threonylcarbamoyl adenosine modification protein YeaZ
VLLAFDTASPTVAVGLYDGTTVLADLVSDQPMRHGEQLAPLIESALAAGAIEPADLTAIAVGVGPGPFTGLRVGLVTARTLGHVLSVPVHGVCTLDVLAAEAVASGAVDGAFAVATDARRKEVYFATYDGAGRRTSGPVVERPTVVATDGPVVGEGALLYPEAFPHAVGPLRASGAWLAKVVDGGLAEVLPPEPLYLRRPDAEIPRAPKAAS